MGRKECRPGDASTATTRWPASSPRHRLHSSGMLTAISHDFTTDRAHECGQPPSVEERPALESRRSSSQDGSEGARAEKEPGRKQAQQRSQDGAERSEGDGAEAGRRWKRRQHRPHRHAPPRGHLPGSGVLVAGREHPVFAAPRDGRVGLGRGVLAEVRSAVSPTRAVGVRARPVARWPRSPVRDALRRPMTKGSTALPALRQAGLVGLAGTPLRSSAR